MNPAIEAKLRELLAIADKHGLMEMAWQEEGLRIAFRRRAAHVDRTTETPSAENVSPNGNSNELTVKSPIVGTFRRSVSKDRPPLVMEGGHVKPGDRLAIIECMKIPTDVVTYNGGEIKDILVKEGDPVEYGQPLFVLAGDGATSENGENHV